MAFTLLVTTGLRCPGGGGGTPTTCETDADCDDGRFCNGEETCGTNGQCEDGEAPCPAEDCVENADFCPECNDDNAAVNCNDDNPCTDDTCNDQRECENVNNTDACDDDNPCTSDDACDGGECAGTPNTDACDDGDACTENDTCANGDCAGTPVECPDGQTCNPATGECEGDELPCTTDDECDDGAFCNGDETCGTNGLCQAGTSPCDPGVECDEDNDFCEDPCTDDTECDDGLFCNGPETCGTSGFCEAGIGPCSGTETCDEDNDDCVPEVQECTTNGDCDDNDPCDGVETCVIGTNGQGTCQEGEPPCDPVTEICEIGDDDQPVCLPAPGPTINFTLGQDNLVGTSAGDTFRAPLELTGLGAQAPTLQNGDVANGLAGDDVLNATYNNLGGGAVTLAPTLSGIETFNLSDFGGTFATTFSGSNVTGVTEINSVGSLANVTVTNLTSLTDLGLFNTDFDLNVTYISPAGNTNADAITLTLDGARDTVPGAGAPGASVIITTPPNGIETLNLASTGLITNNLEALTQVGGTTMTTLNVTGSTSLVISRDAPLPGTLTTINAGGATGSTDMTVGGALNVTYTGGSGNDIINFAGTYTTGDIINGGGGVNTLGLNAAQAAVGVAQANVSNTQNIMIVNTMLGENVDVTRFGATDAILDSTGAALLLNLPSSITLAAGNRTITFNNDDINDALNVIVSGPGTSDTLTANFFNADHTFGGTAVTFTGAETVNVVSGNGLDGTAADGNANTAISLALSPTIGGGTLNFSGPVAFTITGGTTAGAISASSLGAAFTMETTTATIGTAASVTVTGSAFNDELVGGAFNDSISGGEGNDQIKGFQGFDIVTGGNGNDHFFYDNVNQFGDTITDMTAGTDDVGLASGIINFAGIAGTEAAPVALTAANFETARANISSIAAGDALKIVRISTELSTADITSQTGAAVAAYALVFDSTIGRGVLYHDADWSSAGGRALVARFENITTNAQLQALTFTDFEEID